MHSITQQITSKQHQKMKRSILTLFFMMIASLTWAQHKFELSQSTAIGDWTFTNGCSISNESGKSYSTGTDGTIKYSAGVIYTLLTLFLKRRRTTMTNGYRCVSVLFLHHQLCHWFANDIRTTEYHAFLS